MSGRSLVGVAFGPGGELVVASNETVYGSNSELVVSTSQAAPNGADSDSGGSLRRSVTAKVAPPSALLRASMVPPCAWMIVCAIVGRSPCHAISSSRTV